MLTVFVFVHSQARRVHRLGVRTRIGLSHSVAYNAHCLGVRTLTAQNAHCRGVHTLTAQNAHCLGVRALTAHNAHCLGGVRTHTAQNVHCLGVRTLTAQNPYCLRVSLCGCTFGGATTTISSFSLTCDMVTCFALIIMTFARSKHKKVQTNAYLF